MVSSGWVGGTSLQADLTTVKAALLYAEQVELTSLNLADLEGVLNHEERRALLAAAELGEGTPLGLPDGFRDAWRRQNVGFLPGLQAPCEASPETRLLAEWRYAVAHGLYQSSVERSEFLTAIDSNALVVGDHWRRGQHSDPFVLLAVLAEAGEAALESDAHPLLDEIAWAFVGLLRWDGEDPADGPAPVELSRTARLTANEAFLASYTLAQVEAFPYASMDVVLDVRHQLAPARSRFRAAMAEVAEKVENAPDDPDMRREVVRLYEKCVAPAVQDLDSSIDELGARPTLRRATGAATATFGVAVGAALTFREMIAAAALPISQGISEEMKTRQSLRRQQSGHPYLFLKQADRLLTDRDPG